MLSRSTKQGLVWGGVLILIGVLLLLDHYYELSPWVWIVFLAAAGLGAFGLYLTDRADWSLLLTTYVLWAITLLVALVTLDVLRDEGVAVFAILAVALPFLAVFYRDRAQWWALIPAYVMLAVAVMIGLIGLGILDDLLVPAYVLFAVAIPFFVIYARDRAQWWALIPGGILAVIGVFFLIAEAAFLYIVAFALFLAGAWLLVRAFARGQSGGEAGPPAAEPEVDEPPLE